MLGLRHRSTQMDYPWRLSVFLRQREKHGVGGFTTTRAITAQEEVNVALGGKTVQSSTGFGWEANRAIDASPITCTHTKVTTDNPWWRLDLLDSFYISRVVITNRPNCCAQRLDGAEIHIGNSLENNGNNNTRCGVLYGVAAGQSVSVSCAEMNGRYVNIIIPGSSKILTVCDVKVYMGSAPTGENLALRGQAVQSSTYSTFEAARALDTSLSTCTITDTTKNPWWRVDLLDSYYISRVVVTNRADCCVGRIDGAEIHIGNSLVNNGNNNTRCGLLNDVALGQVVSVSCCDIQGRYVNIIIPGSSKVLSMCDVKVFATKVIKGFIRITFNSSLDMSDPAERKNILNESPDLNPKENEWDKLKRRSTNMDLESEGSGEILHEGMVSKLLSGVLQTHQAL
ncbi:uncharacterized protein [Paramisgurnus dabryanus]|uniref:uncharacterized protein n=1 Tax=Paramisgurnus dabryanus TaxID=90735 RepID=UPI0031F475C8